ncbi:MAG: hypothetical protein NW220_08170 [Leptolyngbyaceae cyanobacterium bins.349]|nr:hypothetical protein [Leptolyngbyaceae cyanobacterium bins.349]
MSKPCSALFPNGLRIASWQLVTVASTVWLFSTIARPVFAENVAQPVPSALPLPSQPVTPNHPPVLPKRLTASAVAPLPVAVVKPDHPSQRLQSAAIHVAQLPPLATPAAPLPVPAPPAGVTPQRLPFSPPGVPPLPPGVVPIAHPNPALAPGQPYILVPVPVYIYVYGGAPPGLPGTTAVAPLPPLPVPAYGAVHPGMYQPGMVLPAIAYPSGAAPMPAPVMSAPVMSAPVMPPTAQTPAAAASLQSEPMSPATAEPTEAAPAPTQPALAPLPAIPQPARPTNQPLIRSTALNQPELRFQGAYILQGGEGSGRARVTGTLPLTPNLLFGGTLDFVEGQAFVDSRNEGINLNELYLAASMPDAPNLRVAIGQLDLTSYFDRNSFAKDGASMFFNPVFQTNPALAATGIGSRQAALLNWSITDFAEAKAAVFSSSRDVSDFSVDGFAGELGLRFGNFIVRGTYATNRDGGQRDGFREIFQVDRGNGRTGLLRGDREEAFGVNAEIFFPEIKMGFFGRYGQYTNRGVDRSANTYNVGLTFLDLFAKNDRLGVAYGQQLSNANLRRRAGDRLPDAFEVFYDFAVLPNLRLGFSFQAADNFSETILGVRVKTDFNMIAPK